MVDVVRLEVLQPVSKMPPAAPVLAVMWGMGLLRSLFNQQIVSLADSHSLKLFPLDMDLLSMDSVEFPREVVHSLITFQIHSSRTITQTNLKQTSGSCSWVTILQENLLMGNV